MAAVRLGRIPLYLREKIVRLNNEGKSQREVHRRQTEKYCYFADPLLEDEKSRLIICLGL